MADGSNLDIALFTGNPPNPALLAHAHQEAPPDNPTEASSSVLPLTIPGLLDLTHVQNSGAAFGLLNAADFPYKPFVMIAIAAIALIAIAKYATQLGFHERTARVGLSLILGGAFGNLIDRALFGHVVDFVDAVAMRLPLDVILELLGVPTSDRDQMYAWSNAVVGSEDPDYGDVDTPHEAVLAAYGRTLHF